MKGLYPKNGFNMGSNGPLDIFPIIASIQARNTNKAFQLQQPFFLLLSSKRIWRWWALDNIFVEIEKASIGAEGWMKDFTISK